MLRRVNERKGHNGAIYQLIGPLQNGGFLSVAGDGWLVEWPADNPELGTLVAQVAGGQLFSAYHFPAKNLYLAGALDGGLHWLYPTTPERNLHLAHHRKGIFAITCIGDAVFCAGGDGVLSRWSLETGRVVESLPLAGAALRCLAYQADLQLLFVGSSDYHIYALDPETLALKYRWQAHNNSVFSLATSPDGHYLISGGRDAYLKKWAISATEAPVLQQAIPAHNFTINELAYSPDGQYILSASRDKTAKLWSAANLELIKVAETIRDRGHVNSVNALCWLSDHRLLTAGDDRRILEWEL